MNILQLLAILPLILMPLQVSMKWEQAASYNAIKVRLDGRPASLEQCVKAGLEVRYRYYLKFCRSERFWLDDCKQEKRYIRSLQYDPTAELYHVSLDLLQDQEKPLEKSFQNVEAAFEVISSTDAILLSSLGADETFDRDALKERYISARIIAECRGENSEFMERFGYFLSLGLVKTSGYDSSWIAFSLAE